VTRPATFVPNGKIESSHVGKESHAYVRYQPEQIVTMLGQIEVGFANEKTTPQACKEAAIVVQTFHRCRKEYGGLKWTRQSG
jgi:hypothetical protein